MDVLSSVWEEVQTRPTHAFSRITVTSLFFTGLLCSIPLGLHLGTQPVHFLQYFGWFLYSLGASTLTVLYIPRVVVFRYTFPNLTRWGRLQATGFALMGLSVPLSFLFPLIGSIVLLVFAVAFAAASFWWRRTRVKTNVCRFAIIRTTLFLFATSLIAGWATFRILSRPSRSSRHDASPASKRDAKRVIAGVLFVCIAAAHPVWTLIGWMSGYKGKVRALLIQSSGNVALVGTTNVVRKVFAPMVARHAMEQCPSLRQYIRFATAFAMCAWILTVVLCGVHMMGLGLSEGFLVVLPFIWALILSALFSIYSLCLSSIFRRIHVSTPEEIASMNLSDTTRAMDTHFPSRLFSPDERDDHDDHDDDNLECTICSEIFVKDEAYRALPCSHSFHTPCIDQWVCDNQSSCPSCSSSFDLPLENKLSVADADAVVTIGQDVLEYHHEAYKAHKAHKAHTPGTDDDLHQPLIPPV